MIYFKDKSYIKEEPLSPGGVDCWKSEDRQTASPGGIYISQFTISVIVFILCVVNCILV